MFFFSSSSSFPPLLAAPTAIPLHQVQYYVQQLGPILKNFHSEDKHESILTPEYLARFIHAFQRGMDLHLGKDVRISLYDSHLLSQLALCLSDHPARPLFFLA